jgi:alpha-galactosidase
MMGQIIDIQENGLYMVLEITAEHKVKLLHFSALPFQDDTIRNENEKIGFRLVEVMVSGLDRPEERHGTKYTVTAPGYRLQYQSHQDVHNEWGRKLEIVTFDQETGLEVTSHFQFFNEIPLVRSWTALQNKGSDSLGLEYVSSFALTGIAKEGLQNFDSKMKLSIAHNSWQRELQWRSYRFPELGFSQSASKGEQRSSKCISLTNTGNWSTKEYLPMGYLENAETGTNLFWQIEHNGSWHWEISDQNNHIYLQLSGPTESESHWWKKLNPGESFVSVPAAVGSTVGDISTAMGELTQYRRIIRRPNVDNQNLPVIFNDYMNCLWAEPTTEKEIPLIDAAAEAGCEYYCIDAGWYSAGYWWDGVGEWLPSGERFPGGIKEVLDYIRSKGMVPGLWLELEVMGIKCPKVKAATDDWFFIRHGKRIADRSRYQLDFRNPNVIAHADEVIDRLVKDYGIGYIKMDYNIEPGIGTEIDSDSFGDGLLGHNRAYLNWLDRVFQRYPGLVIENCSSGGLRMDYAMLSRYSIQSTSDQENYLKYAVIAANAPTALTPEQAAVWSYPLLEGDREEVVFNMVNALLLRIHQSGHLVKLIPEWKELVGEGIRCYKTIRRDIKDALPFWPLGLANFGDPWVCLGLKTGGKNYLAVWRINSHLETCEIPIKHLQGIAIDVKCIYPKEHYCKFEWNQATALLTVSFPEPVCARLFELKPL